MNRTSYIILLIILITIYLIYFTKHSNIKQMLKSIIPKKEAYNDKVHMKHPNYIYNREDALKHKFHQQGRDFTGYFTKIM